MLSRIASTATQLNSWGNAETPERSRALVVLPVRVSLQLPPIDDDLLVKVNGLALHAA